MKRKRTIYIDEDIDKLMRVAAVEDDKFYGEYAEELLLIPSGGADVKCSGSQTQFGASQNVKP